MIKNKIKNIRKIRNVTQKHLAEKINISGGELSYIENNKRPINLDLLDKIGEELDTCPLELLECQCNKCKNKK